MTNKENRTMKRRPNAETHILGQIVDAILEAETVLEQASVDEWKRVLMDSCRRRKDSDSTGYSAIAFTC